MFSPRQEYLVTTGFIIVYSWLGLGMRTQIPKHNTHRRWTQTLVFSLAQTLLIRWGKQYNIVSSCSCWIHVFQDLILLLIPGSSISPPGQAAQTPRRPLVFQEHFPVVLPAVPRKTWVNIFDWLTLIQDGCLRIRFIEDRSTDLWLFWGENKNQPKYWAKTQNLCGSVRLSFLWLSLGHSLE